MDALKNKAQGPLGKVLLALLSTAGVLLAVEFAVGWWAAEAKAYPGVVYRTDDPNVELWCYDGRFNGTADWDLRREYPYVGLRYVGNIDDDDRLAGLDPSQVHNAVEVRLNGLQFRERPEVDLVNAYRLGGPVTLILGDSFCFGQGIRLADRFSNVIQARLDAEGRDHTVYNMCVPGMNIQRIARVQREAVKRFGAPVRVIYSYTLNDPIRDARTKALEDTVYDLMHFRRSQFERAHRSPLWRSAVWRWLAERRQMQQVAERTIAWYQQLYGDNPGWRQTTRVLADMQAFSRERNIELVLVFFPIFHQLGDYPLQVAHRQLGWVAREHGIASVDLLDLFGGRDERDFQFDQF